MNEKITTDVQQPRCAQLLTALMIAVKSVSGYDQRVSRALFGAANSLLGINCVAEVELEQMEGWMLHAIEGSGSHNAAHPQRHHHERTAHRWQISHEEVATFLRKWGGTFYPSRLAAQDHLRKKQRERFWGSNREEHSSMGSFHGHGNTHWPLEDAADYQLLATTQQHSHVNQNVPMQQYCYEGSEPF